MNIILKTGLGTEENMFFREIVDNLKPVMLKYPMSVHFIFNGNAIINELNYDKESLHIIVLGNYPTRLHSLDIRKDELKRIIHNLSHGSNLKRDMVRGLLPLIKSQLILFKDENIDFVAINTALSKNNATSNLIFDSHKATNKQTKYYLLMIWAYTHSFIKFDKLTNIFSV